MAADDVEALATALRNAIAKQGDRVKDVFKALDKDGDGSVSQKEFSDGILGLGLPLAKEQFAHIDGAPSPAHPPPQSCVHTRRLWPCNVPCDSPPPASSTGLFALLDADSSGSIDYRELNKKLRKDALQLGSRNKSPLRKRSGSPSKSTSFTLGDVDGDGDGQVDSDEMVAALKKALKENATRIIDLFKEWDEDGDGNVSKKEFLKALPQLGIDVDKETASTLFDAFDPDGGGDISYKELSSKLHDKDDAALEASIRKASQRSAALKKQRKTHLSKEERQGGAYALRDGPMGKSSQLQGLDIDEESDVPVAQQLRNALSKNAMRVIDLFREWLALARTLTLTL